MGLYEAALHLERTSSAVLVEVLLGSDLHTASLAQVQYRYNADLYLDTAKISEVLVL